KSTISRHIKNVFEEGELSESATVAKFATVQIEGSRNVERDIDFYNLDVIISVGYRVKSIRGTQFRIWANTILKEYIKKGFVLDDERLKGNGGGNYWKELLDRIRDIRSSEKVLYRQVLDLYATSVDYNPKCDESIKFFKLVQNKLHYAAHGHTAAEVIYERADSQKPFMGLTSFEGELPSIKDIKIAKNYLSESELKILNNLVSGYFDLAEINAIEHKPMYMSDYVEQLDSVLTSGKRKLLEGAGKVSHEKALKKAEEEYRKYQVITLSPVEEAYLESIKAAEKEAKKQVKK
nr:virulence RhuM family protein [Treponema sp.]